LQDLNSVLQVRDGRGGCCKNGDLRLNFLKTGHNRCPISFHHLLKRSQQELVL
jgi:hypothetical protein